MWITAFRPLLEVLMLTEYSRCPHSGCNATNLASARKCGVCTLFIKFDEGGPALPESSPPKARVRAKKKDKAEEDFRVRRDR